MEVTVTTMVIHKTLILLLAMGHLWGAEKICYFTPPKNWSDANPKLLSSSVKMGYFGKGNENFHPSINLAVEQVDDVTLKEYLKIVKEIHQSNRSTVWRDLGAFHTKAGKAHLTEISMKHQVGEIKMLQIILITEGFAYILTGSSLKEDLPSFRKDFISAFRSTSLTDDLYAPLQQEQQNTLKALIESTKASYIDTQLTSDQKKKKLLNFHSHVVEKYQDMGQYWQYLVIKDLHDLLVPDKK